MKERSSVDSTDGIPAESISDDGYDVVDEVLRDFESSLPEDPFGVDLVLLEPPRVLESSSESGEDDVSISGSDGVGEIGFQIGESVERGVDGDDVEFETTVEGIGELEVDLVVEAFVLVLEVEEVGGDDVGEFGDELITAKE